MSSIDERFVAGDSTALDEVYDAHGQVVYSFCRQRLDDETAREVTQDVFVSAWKARTRFDPDVGSLRTWLMAIARNRIIDVYRHRSRRPNTIDNPEVIDLTGDPTADGSELERTAERMMLAQAISELPERARSMIELSFYGQLSHAEIASKTGVPLGTVKSDIRRSLLKLKQSLAYDQEVNDV